MTQAPTERFGHWMFAAFIALYTALLFSQVDHGLASLDGHGIVRVTQHLIDNHAIDISRPPGHPTTEFYLFGAVGWILRTVFDAHFDEQTYLFLQAGAAVVTLIVFYGLLRRLGAKSWQALLGTISLALSAQYFANAVDGEEFIFALCFVLLAVRCLIVSTPAVFYLCMSILCYALATGCRPEIAFAGVIYPIYFWCRPKLEWKSVVVGLLFGAVAMFLVWVPIIAVGVHAPYDAKMNLRAALLVGGYKLVFQCFGLFVFLLLCLVLGAALVKLRTKLRQPFPDNFVFAVSVLLPIVFFALFFRYATKPAYVLVTLPFLIFLVLDRSNAILTALVTLTVLQCFISIDIFQDRQLVRPFVTQGSLAHVIFAKPYYKRDYLRTLARQCDARPTLIIANAWPWDFEYNMRRIGSSARRETISHRGEQDVAALFPDEGGACVLLERDAAYQIGLLEEWQNKGYQIKMETALYREMFARYDVAIPNSSIANVGPVSMSLFSLKEAQP